MLITWREVHPSTNTARLGKCDTTGAHRIST